MWRFPFVRLVSAVAGVVVALAGVLYMAHAPLLAWVGAQLIRNDRLVPADAIAVLASSEFAERELELEAADLYHVLSVGREPPCAIEMARRGVALSSPLDVSSRRWVSRNRLSACCRGGLSRRSTRPFSSRTGARRKRLTV